MRLWIVIVGLLLVVAACGDDDGGTTTAAAGVASTLGMELSDDVGDPATPGASAATGAARTGSLILLSDDFQDGDASGWDIHFGWFMHGAGGQYLMAASDAAWAWWPDGESWEARYVLRASVRVNSGGLAVSVAVGPEGRYVLHFREDGTDLLLDRPWGTFEPLVGGPPIELGVWHGLAVGIDGGQIQVYVDGTPLLQHDVSSPLTSGSVGFGALYESVVGFDNVLVNVLQGSLPAAQFPQPSAPAEVETELVVDDPLDDVQPSGGPDELPDLDFTGVEFDKSSYRPGEPVTVSVLVHNASDQAVGPFSVAWVTEDAGCTAEVATIAPRETLAPQCTSAGFDQFTGDWAAFVDDDERVAERDEANNMGWGWIEVSGTDATLPNLVGNYVSFWHHTSDRGFSRHAPTADLPFGIGMLVDDLNGYPGDIGTYTVRFLIDGQVACAVDMTGPTDWGPEPDLSHFCDHPGLALGPHVLEAVIDAEGDIPETREDDNRYTHEFVVSVVDEPETVDLSIFNVVFDPPQPRAGEDFFVTVNVDSEPNSGDAPLADHTIRWVLEDGGIACEWGTTTWFAGHRCTWRFDAPGTYRWRARVDATDTIAEANEDNNVLTGTVTVGP